MTDESKRDEAWPPLPLAEWQDTYDTVHLWLQVVGKVRLALTPLLNHWWNTTLYVTPRGLTTSAIPYGGGAFEIRFDFLSHEMIIETSRGEREVRLLRPLSCADFYEELMGILRTLGIEVHVWPVAVELPEPIHLDTDRVHCSYDAGAVQRCWRILLSASQVMEEFRARFVGKCSPVHFFWGSFDLAVTRFSGRPAPKREGTGPLAEMMDEAYSHEVISAGFWPGSGTIQEPAFYAYAAPVLEGLGDAPVQPAAAQWNQELGEFVLPYEAVRTAESPRQTLLDFLQSTYDAAADLGGWNRAELERS
jgi:hypothetical protein